MIQRLFGLTMCTLLIFALTGCGSKTAEAEKIVSAHLDGFENFVDQGDKFAERSLDIQADYTYGWAAASVSGMRYCIDCLLYMKGEGASLEEVAAGRPDDWDEIAAMNYASPYPYYYEGLVYNAEAQNAYAQHCYERALINPAFSAEYAESLVVLEVLPVESLKRIKARLTALEDRFYAEYEPQSLSVPRSEFNFSDAYLRTAAKEILNQNAEDYQLALNFYQAAITVNPFEGDNFLGCALMCLYLNDIKGAVYYINEGLLIDPEHEGLMNLAEAVNKEASL
jgi:tetratricopeptide (TPR) repeat protein